MKHRLLVIANIGFIIGIITGLYFRNSIILFLSIFVVIWMKIFKKMSTRGIVKTSKVLSQFYFLKRYLRVYVSKKVIITFVVCFVLGFVLLTVKENKFQTFIQDMNHFNGTKPTVYATVVSNKEEKEYSDMYKIKILNINGKNYSNTYCLIKLNKANSQALNYGDLIHFEGEFQEPQDSTNYKGFSYKEYLKTINTCGIFKTTYNKINILKHENLSPIYLLANKVKSSFERTNRKIV